MLLNKKILASLILIEPPYTEPYVRWCERTEVNHLLLLDYTCERAAKSVQFHDLYASKEERRNKRRICFLGSGAKTKEKENEKMGSDVILYDWRRGSHVCIVSIGSFWNFRSNAISESALFVRAHIAFIRYVSHWSGCKKVYIFCF